MTRRERTSYFEAEPGSPAPLRIKRRRRVRFSEVDPMAIVWFGRYAIFFEEGAEEMGRCCGMSYRDFLEGHLRAPIIEYHVDYFRSLFLDEEFTISCSLIWCEGARLNTEYELIKDDGTVAARGYTVQVFIGAEDSQVRLVTPPMLETCRARWKAGQFKDLQS